MHLGTLSKITLLKVTYGEVYCGWPTLQSGRLSSQRRDLFYVFYVSRVDPVFRLARALKRSYVTLSFQARFMIVSLIASKELVGIGG